MQKVFWCCVILSKLTVISDILDSITGWCRKIVYQHNVPPILPINKYTVSGKKKRPQFSRHNFDKLRHSFVIFGTNHPDTPVY